MERTSLCIRICNVIQKHGCFPLTGFYEWKKLKQIHCEVWDEYSKMLLLVRGKFVIFQFYSLTNAKDADKLTFTIIRTKIMLHRYFVRWVNKILIIENKNKTKI